MGLEEDDLARLRTAVGSDTFAGRFEIEREAGRGGMGTVYEARERATDRAVAIKVLADETELDHARFSAEAAILERMAHPAIVGYIGHGVTTGGRPYLAMAWLDGDSLAKRLKQGRLSVGDTVAVGVRVAGALAHAHAQDVLHRDLKPSNVILAGGDPAQAILIDFGIAKDTSTKGLTHTGQLLGTPSYMAPEQATGSQPLDGRADLFALGCLLYECLTGAPPFDGRELLEVLARVLLHDPPRVATVVPGVPKRLDALIFALLAKEPERRLADAMTAASELRAIQVALAANDHEALAKQIDPPTLASAVTRRARLRAATEVPPPRTRRAIAIAALGVAAAAGISIAVATHRGSEVTSPVEPRRSGSSGPRVELPCSGEAQPRCVASCDAGEVRACISLASALNAHPNDLEGRKASLTYLRRACDLGHGLSCMQAGTKLWSMRSLDPTVQRSEWEALYQRGCDLRESGSCITFAVRLLRDDPRDPPRAVALLEHACNIGNAAGCRQAAEVLRSEAAGIHDPDRATRLLAAACARGIPAACESGAGSSASRP